jgi:hypothetical protein
MRPRAAPLLVWGLLVAVIATAPSEPASGSADHPAPAASEATRAFGRHRGGGTRRALLPGGTSPRVWQGEILTLPSAGLSDSEPTIGNGILAAALNSKGRPAPAGHQSLGSADNRSMQLYLGSNNMWEFVNVTKEGHSHYYPAAMMRPPGIGGRVALGGLSIHTASLAASAAAHSESAPLTEFYAEERIATGEIFARRSYPTGVFELLVSIERNTSSVLTTGTWRPNSSYYSSSADDHSDENLTAIIEVSTWVPAGRPTTASVDRKNSSSIAVVTRGAVPRDLVEGSPLAIVGALATTLLSGSGGGARLLSPVTARAATNDTTQGSEVRHRLRIQAHRPFSLVTTYSDSILAADPAAAVVASASALIAEEAAAGENSSNNSNSSAVARRLRRRSTDWWERYWSSTHISLPGHPNIGYIWTTANYMGARDSSERSDAAAPGLFGPMITSDRALWGGDFTLDFDLEKQYFGTAGSNHGELVAAYFANILQFRPSASRAAQHWISSSKANGTLPAGCDAETAAKALHFPCHIGPWGMQSRDRSIYNHWNGELSALIFIQNWEYYRDSVFARQHIYPLLDGLTAFRRCSLTRTELPGAADGGGGGSSYRYDILDDSAHEGFIVNNSVRR